MQSVRCVISSLPLDINNRNATSMIHSVLLYKLVGLKADNVENHDQCVAF